MLNYTFAMWIAKLLLLMLSILPLTYTAPSAAPPPQAAQSALAILHSPLPGQALLGDILITGNTAVDGFTAYEISFGYADDPTGTWFLIQRSTLPVDNGLLAHWDTTTITDGNYTIQMVVVFSDDSEIALTIPGLRVRNYTPIETDTPTPLPPSATPAPGTPLPPTASPTITPFPSNTPLPPTPTPLPTNPAILSTGDLTTTILKGSGIGLGLLALLGIYLAIRNQIYNR